MQSDQVGTVNLLSDSNGIVQGRQKALPFGERMTGLGETSVDRFAGHEDQPGSAIYMQARMYLPVYGKFAQPDPAYDQHKYNPETWNLYGYVANNPVTQSDPTGLSTLVVNGAVQYAMNARVDPENGLMQYSGELDFSASEWCGIGVATVNWGGQGNSAQTALTQETLQKLGFTADQAKALAAANVTVAELVAAVLTHENRGLTTAGDSSAIQAAVIAVVNRTLDPGYMKDANKTGVSQAGVANNDLLKVISDIGYGGQFRSLTGGAKESNRGFISDIMLGNKTDMGYAVAKDKLASYGTTSLEGFRQIWDSPTHMRYDIGNRNSFHGSGAIEPVSKNPLIIGPNVYFEGP